MKVKFTLKDGYSFTSEVAQTVKLAPHFTLKELANNAGDKTLPQFEINERVDEFIDMLEEFRVWYGKAINVNSGYRQAKYNTKIGGDPNSAHKLGCAIDFTAKGQTNTQRANVANKWREICTRHKVIGAINYYTNGYHLEAFSDICYKSTSFKIRDYRNTSSDW